jgi:acetolactate synthase-1/3 small subunit
MSLSDEGALRRVQLQIRGRDEGRSTENLGRQIDKLVGATRVGFSAVPYGYQSGVAA